MFAMKGIKIDFPWAKSRSVQDTEILLESTTRGTDRASTVDTESIESTSDPPDTPLALAKHSTKENLRGWRRGILWCALLGVAVFALNLSVAIWASANFPHSLGVAVVYSGSCSKTKSSATWIRLAINVLSTLLLGASNFCMQISSSPTREDVDAAHAKRRWLTIGAPSFKNLLHIEWRKSALWVLLGSSSVPLHLLWNSAVVDTLTTNEYVINAVAEGFVRGEPWNTTIGMAPYPEVAMNISKKIETNSLVNMSVTECINAYAAQFNPSYGNLALVYDIQHANNSLLWQEYQEGAMSGGVPTWMCYGIGQTSMKCDTAQLIHDNLTHWNPWNGFDFGGYTWEDGGGGPPQHEFFIIGNVQYCLVDQTNRPCQLGISPQILTAVLVCNAVKIVCFILTFWVGSSMSDPLVTNGDAVQSFLLKPDPRLAGRCLASKADVQNNTKFWSEDEQMPLQWWPRRRRWVAGAALDRWLATFIPGIILLIAIIALCVANDVWTAGTQTFVSSGFGKPDLNALLDPGNMSLDESPVTASLLANIPQLLVSYIYLAYNGLFTCMLATAEWMRYSVVRQGLRVTWPRGCQRARTYLQIPYTYGVPLIVASALLHWLISQSLFLVRITPYAYGGAISEADTISAVGYSPYAIIFAVCMGGLMLLVALVLEIFKRYPDTMPLAACCSASIAASCYISRQEAAKDTSLALKKIQWGVVDQSVSTFRNAVEEVGHACFSTNHVQSLAKGEMYA